MSIINIRIVYRLSGEDDWFFILSFFPDWFARLVASVWWRRLIRGELVRLLFSLLRARLN